MLDDDDLPVEKHGIRYAQGIRDVCAFESIHSLFCVRDEDLLNLVYCYQEAAALRTSLANKRAMDGWKKYEGPNLFGPIPGIIIIFISSEQCLKVSPFKELRLGIGGACVNTVLRMEFIGSQFNTNKTISCLSSLSLKA